MRRITKAAALGVSAIALSSFAVSAAWAETIYAVTGDKTILVIDADDYEVERRVEIRNGPRRLAGIDIRPSDGRLYGVFTNGRVAVINPRSGFARLGPRINFDFSKAKYSFDFNPVVDRLRIVGSNDDNLRANVDDGTFTQDLPITSPSPNPFGDTDTSIIGVAYTNSFTGAVATQLYDIDSDPEALYLQVPPNNGTLSAVGRIDFRIDDLGFDIFVDSKKRNRGWIVTRGRLAEIDLAGGAVVSVERLQGLDRPVRDIAVVDDDDDRDDDDDTDRDDDSQDSDR